MLFFRNHRWWCVSSTIQYCLKWTTFLLYPAVTLIHSRSSSHWDQWGLMSLCCVESKDADKNSNNNTNADITVTLKQSTGQINTWAEISLRCAGIGLHWHTHERTQNTLTHTHRFNSLLNLLLTNTDTQRTRGCDIRATNTKGRTLFLSNTYKHT